MVKKSIWKRWWMIVIYVCLGLFLLSAIFGDNSTCDCSIVEKKLETCEYQSLQAVNAWNDYVDALENYCNIDYTNPLCLTLP